MKSGLKNKKHLSIAIGLFAILFPMLLITLFTVVAGRNTSDHFMIKLQRNLFGPANYQWWLDVLVYQGPAVIALAFLPIKRLIRIVVIIIYMPLMWPFMYLWALLLACTNGACL